MMKIIGMIKMMKTYSELIELKTFEERLKYLQLNSNVGYETFGSHRYLNQRLYNDSQWKDIRRKVIIRDSDNNYVLDLAHIDHPFNSNVYVHHINPITIDDLLNRNPIVFDMENLISTKFSTHQLIHYGLEAIDNGKIIIREKNDTCSWKG